MFVKPSNSGSSVGVKKATNKEELKMAIENAGQYDSKILVEQGVNARELECAILDEKEIKVSTVGEILSAEEFNTICNKLNDDQKNILALRNPDGTLMEDVEDNKDSKVEN